MPLHVTLVPAPDQIVVRVTGDADLSTAPLIADGLSRSAGLGTRQVVVDVAGTQFWDCSGLHALTQFTAELGAEGRACRIVGAPARTRRLICAAHLEDQLLLDGPLTSWAVSAGDDRSPGEGPPSRPTVPARRAASGHRLMPRRMLPALALRRRG